MKCSENVLLVQNAIVNFRNTGSYLDAKRSGQPRKTTPWDDHVIQKAEVRSPMSFASKIRAVLLVKSVDTRVVGEL